MSSASLLVGLLMWGLPRDGFAQRLRVWEADVEGIAASRLPHRVGSRQSDDPRQRAGRDRVGPLASRGHFCPRNRVGEAGLHLAQETFDRAYASARSRYRGGFGAVR